MRISYYLCCVLLLLTTACVNKTAVRHSIGYHDVLRQESGLLLLPPEITINTVNAVAQTERMYNYEYFLEDLLQRELRTAISNKGYPVLQLTKADIHNAHLADAMITLRQQYTPVISTLYTPYYQPEAIASTIQADLGKSPFALAQKTGNTLLVLVDYVGSVKTNSARVKDLTLDVVLGSTFSSNVDGTYVTASVIDANTGNIIWSHSVADSKNLYESAWDNFQTQEEVELARIKKLLSKLFEPLPFKSDLYKFAS